MHLQCVLKSATIVGVSALPVDVEVVVSNGLPGMTIVGMPDAAVRESQERVRAAIRACGFTMPRDKVVVNLAPGSLRKVGAGFDLPIAAAILGATGQVDSRKLEKYLWAGELSLEGAIRPVKGVIAYASCARDLGLSLAVSCDSQDCAPLEGIEQFGFRSLAGLRTFDPAPLLPKVYERGRALLDFGEIRGHEAAKRAMQIAAAGGHGILLMGPPGSGKTMLAKALSSILPPLGEKERIQAAMVHSVAGEPIGAILAGARPFRCVHHSASMAGLVGGGTPVRPGDTPLRTKGSSFSTSSRSFRPPPCRLSVSPWNKGSSR